MNQDELYHLIARANTFAKQDATLIEEQLAGTNVRVGLAEQGVALICDGSAYSPSWRALSGGSQVWDMQDGSVSDQEQILIEQMYTETLDERTNELGLFWENGCLWISDQVVKDEEGE